jgi:hypothetical protein
LGYENQVAASSLAVRRKFIRSRALSEIFRHSLQRHRRWFGFIA